MRATSLLLGALLATVALAPFAAADNNTYNVPPTVDVNVHNNGGNAPSESSGFYGLNTTVVIVLVVLAILVIALVVAMASRPGYP